MNLLEKLAFIPGIIVEGTRLTTGMPRRIKLEVDREWESRREAARLDHLERYGADLPLPMNMGIPPWPYKVIPLKFWRTDYKYWESVPICIDLETRKIDFHRFTSGWLLGEKHHASDTAVLLFFLPFAIPLSPFLYGTAKYYAWIEKRRGMSRHGVALLEALKGQLDAETEALLVEALKNTWSEEQAMSRIVTIAEAKQLLSRCDLLVEQVTAEQAAECGDTASTSFDWFDDQGTRVANGSFYGQRDHFVRVLGSTFEDAQADELIKCYRSRKERIVGQSDDTEAPPTN